MINYLSQTVRNNMEKIALNEKYSNFTKQETVENNTLIRKYYLDDSLVFTYTEKEENKIITQNFTFMIRKASYNFFYKGRLIDENFTSLIASDETKNGKPLKKDTFIKNLRKFNQNICDSLGIIPE